MSGARVTPDDQRARRLVGVWAREKNKKKRGGGGLG
jgi:hypothetical protein